MLAGVLLTDQQQRDRGNLWVWPGSHLIHQHLFQERGTRVLQATGGHATALDPPVALPEPVPVFGKRGDLVLAHFLLGHNKGGNLGPLTRRTIYYRLSVPGHPQRWDQTFVDAWNEYPKMRVLGTGCSGEAQSSDRPAAQHRCQCIARWRGHVAPRRRDRGRSRRSARLGR